MKKRKLFLAITSIVVLCVLLTSMTACLKIGMRQSNIENKLKDAGASIRYERNTPMTKDGQGDHKLEDLVYATMTYVETVDGVETDVTRKLYVIFAGDDSSASWAEERCRAYVLENAELCDGWETYRSDRVVMCGYYKVLAIARGY